MAMLAAFLSVAACGEDRTMPVPDNVIQLVERLAAAPALTRAAVESAVGAPLRTGDGNSSFAFYEAEGLKAGDAQLAVDFREPVSGGGATSGALLNLKVGGTCVARPDVESRFGPLTVTGAPRGRSPNEETKLSRDEPWGRLTFGFADRAPACLSSVTFARK